ncbi:MAG: hypothetical protein HN509_11540 [Halobacteriovoraceae bacterium]|nr:hypothetical protein [Halobacteriovoraceae bacterium]MBT5093994.1 hypothetical protein [Halobacteriovoraceae bacterium]
MNSELKGIWLSILEYSNYRDLSISTVRRYIKADRVRYKKENGKFFIYAPAENVQKVSEDKREVLALKMEVQRLEDFVKTLQEENNDLKMLVQIYEKPAVLRNEQPPALPGLPL